MTNPDTTQPVTDETLREPSYSPEIRAQAYAMQNMSHAELCQAIVDIDNKGFMTGFKNGKFAAQAQTTKARIDAYADCGSKAGTGTVVRAYAKSRAHELQNQKAE